MRPRFRLVGVEEPRCVDRPAASMKLADMARILADAHRTGRAWLEDFAHEDVQLSQDLFEVLTAYDHLRRAA